MITKYTIVLKLAYKLYKIIKNEKELDADKINKELEKEVNNCINEYHKKYISKL
jgi:hypothetical protein